MTEEEKKEYEALKVVVKWLVKRDAAAIREVIYGRYCDDKELSDALSDLDIWL